MNEACSVVFVHSPFVVLFEGKELSLESGSALLVRGGAGSLLPFSECFRRISLSESTIIRYLLCGDEKQDVVLVRQIPRYLCVSFPKAELMGILIDYLCEEKIHTDNLAEMLSFSCLAFFSSEKMFSSFLTACIGNISDRLREGANKRGNSSRLTQSFHFFMFEPIFSPVNALNQPI